MFAPANPSCGGSSAAETSLTIFVKGEQLEIDSFASRSLGLVARPSMSRLPEPLHSSTRSEWQEAVLEQLA